MIFTELECCNYPSSSFRIEKYIFTLLMKSTVKVFSSSNLLLSCPLNQLFLTFKSGEWYHITNPSIFTSEVSSSEHHLIWISVIVPAGLTLLSKKITWTKRNHFILPSGFQCETSVIVKCWQDSLMFSSFEKLQHNANVGSTQTKYRKFLFIYY